MAYNVADEKQVQDQLKNDKLKREQELMDIKVLLDHPAGLRFFKRIMDDGHIFQSTFTGNSQTYFLEGQRGLALRYFWDIAEVDPERVGDLLIRREGERDNGRKRK